MCARLNPKPAAGLLFVLLFALMGVRAVLAQGEPLVSGMAPTSNSQQYVIAAGTNYSCAIVRGGAMCWGANWSGSLGDGTSTNSASAVNVKGLNAGVQAITVPVDMGAHSCAVTSSGGVKCWGDNGVGQLGAYTDGKPSSVPLDVSGLTAGVKAVAVGGTHSCALTTSGGIKCWGYSKFGALGDGTLEQRLAPVDVVGLTSGVAAISAGTDHTCALMQSGAVKCWGNNGSGDLGDGTTTHRLTPVDVKGLTSGVVAIAAGEMHTCALSAGGAVLCWGNNMNGQLGNETAAQQQLTPYPVTGLAPGVTAVSAGSLHTCAIMAGGTAKCWGDNFFGQVGNGTNKNQYKTPVDVLGIASGAVAISAGNEHSCALLANNTVKCWGRNNYGQLGDGTLNDRLTAVDVHLAPAPTTPTPTPTSMRTPTPTPTRTPIVDFNASPRMGTAPLVVQFSNLSQFAFDNYLWAFGDGGNSFEREPVHIYSSPGTYDVALSVSGPGNYSQRTMKSSYVKVNPLLQQITVTANYPFVSGSSKPIDGASTVWAPILVEATDSNGVPVEGAEINIIEDGHDLSTGQTTDAEGRNLYNILLLITDSPKDKTIQVRVEKDNVSVTSNPITLWTVTQKTWNNPHEYTGDELSLWNDIAMRIMGSFTDTPLDFTKEYVISVLGSQGIEAFSNMLDLFLIWDEYKETIDFLKIGDRVYRTVYEFRSSDTIKGYLYYSYVERNGHSLGDVVIWLSPDSRVAEEWIKELNTVRAWPSGPVISVVKQAMRRQEEPLSPARLSVYVTSPNGDSAGIEPATGQGKYGFPMVFSEAGQTPFYAVPLPALAGRYTVKIQNMDATDYLLTIFSLNAEGVRTEPIQVQLRGDESSLQRYYLNYDPSSSVPIQLTRILPNFEVFLPLISQH